MVVHIIRKDLDPMLLVNRLPWLTRGICQLVHTLQIDDRLLSW